MESYFYNPTLSRDPLRPIDVNFNQKRMRNIRQRNHR